MLDSSGTGEYAGAGTSAAGAALELGDGLGDGGLGSLKHDGARATQ